MAKEHASRGIRSGGGWVKWALLALAVVVALALATPYWVGQRIERQYVDTLAQLEETGYLRVENVTYQRGWWSAEARYELVPGPRLERLVERFHAFITDEGAMAAEIIRAPVVDHISHGPLHGALARIEGHSSVGGWMFDEFLIAEPAEFPHEISVGFSGGVDGTYHPASLVMRGGEPFDELGMEYLFELDYRGGDFHYDPATNEFVASGQIERMLVEDGQTRTLWEDYTSRIAMSFPEGRLREVVLHSEEGPIRSEVLDPELSVDTYVGGQTTESALYFDEQGSLSRLTGRGEVADVRMIVPEFTVSMRNLDVDFNSERQGDGWYGALGMMAREVRLDDEPLAAELTFDLGLEPQDDEILALTLGGEARDLRLPVMEESLAVQTQVKLGELQRGAYDALWSLMPEMFYAALREDIDAVQELEERLNESAMSLLGEYTSVSMPLTLKLGQADFKAQLEGMLPLRDIDELGEEALFMPGTYLELNASTSALLLQKLFRENLRQMPGGMAEEELDAMAEQMAAGQAQELAAMGILREEQDGDRYALHVELRDGEVWVNGEPGDWLGLLLLPF